jgi:methylated-DNA-[protein]-cysteine S-methyltransferase
MGRFPGQLLNFLKIGLEFYIPDKGLIGVVDASDRFSGRRGDVSRSGLNDAKSFGNLRETEKPMSETKILFVDSPIGTIELREKNGFLTRLNFRGKTTGTEIHSGSILSACAAQLKEYFAGKRAIFDLPLAPEGTLFQLDVWNALRTVLFGRTASYGEIARMIGRPAAARAVGEANGANPVSIIIPCHRIVGTNGCLTGYGGGLWCKEWLLEHERKYSGAAGARPLFDR